MTIESDYTRLMRGVIPYLTIDGVDAATAFYQKAMGAILHGNVTRAPDSGKVLNALLEINGGAVMLVDYFADMPEGPAKADQGFMMQIVTHDGQAFWDRAIAAGCKIVAPFETQFWGDTWGRFNDPFGIGWAVNQPGAENIAKAESGSQ
jgi:PhnB protein